MSQRPSQLRMCCLGGFHFEAGGTTSFDFGTKKARALLVYLAVEAPRSFRRSHLAGLLWSEYSQENALHNLRQTLVRLRKGWARHADGIPLLVAHKDTIAINPDVEIWVDVLAFETAIDRAFTFFHDRTHLEGLDIQSLIDAVYLFKGPFLDRFSLFDTLLFDEWASLVRERTTKKALEAHNLLCEYYERRGDYVQAAQLADRIAALAPWSNRACAHCMRLYAIQKQWVAAKRQYDQFRDYLIKNVDVTPNATVSALYEEIKTSSHRDEAMLPAVDVIEDHVPELSSSFVGRQVEIRDLSHRLADPQMRLISLVGQGGTGKTRLAVEIGHLVRGLYAQGVFFIPLRDISSLEGLVWLMAERLMCHFSGTTSHDRQLLDFLREKQTLLILDGCEHYLLRDQIGELIAEILAGAPDVKILATSRERIMLPEEHVFSLVGLDHQSGDSLKSEGAILPTEAVKLFEVRAKQVDHHFTFTETTLPLVQELCQRMAGHPLSIELIASATGTLSIPDLIDDLNASQQQWDFSHADLHSEVRSLSIILERSWQLMSEVQRATLSRLVSFQGGFTEAAALQIAQTTSDMLNSLVEKSFVHKTSKERFMLHEIIQEFGTQKAHKHNMLNSTRESHALYFIGLLESIAKKNQSFLQIEALEQIEEDLENILTAWRYFVEMQVIKKLECSIDILFQFFNIRSLFEEGISLFQNTLHSASYLPPFDPVLGMLANRLGSLALRIRKNELALGMYSRALAIFEGKGISIELGLAQIGLGYYYLRVKDFDKARAYAQQGLGSFQFVGDRNHEGTAYFLLGLIYERFADYPTAKSMLTESLNISRQIGDQRGMILRLNQLAGHDCNAGDFESAEIRYLESLGLSRAFKDRFQQAIILNNLASVYHPRGEYEKEQSVLEESLAICREIGDLDGEAIALNNLGELAIVQGEFKKALGLSRAALDIALRLGEDWTIIAVYDILGCAYLGLGDVETADQCLMQAIRRAFQIQSWDLLTRSLVNLAEVYLVRDDHVTAMDLIIAALLHPSLLFEYGNKARELLEELGGIPPTVEDADVLFAVLQRYFDL